MLILKLLIFAMPVTIAAILHMVIVRLNLLKHLATPLDFGKTLCGKPIFGKNKTFRGVIVMVLLSIAGSWLLFWLVTINDEIHRLNILAFNLHSPTFLGLMYGLGYTLAELPNSFVKRQRGIPEGERGGLLHVIVDQIDSPLGCLILLFPFSNMNATFFVAGALLFLFLHLFFNVVLFLLKLRTQPF